MYLTGEEVQPGVSTAHPHSVSVLCVANRVKEATQTQLAEAAPADNSNGAQQQWAIPATTATAVVATVGSTAGSNALTQQHSLHLHRRGAVALRVRLEEALALIEIVSGVAHALEELAVLEDARRL